MRESVKFCIVILIIALVSCNQGSDDEVHKRVRRHLVFQNGTRILFRILVKDNILKIHQIFAHGFGFRANIDMLQPPRPRQHLHHKISRREVYATIEQLLIQQGFDGRACIFKMLCDAYEMPSTESGMFSKLFKILFTHRGAEYDGVNITKLLSKSCHYLHDHCPLTMLDIAPYTDVAL